MKAMLMLLYAVLIPCNPSIWRVRGLLDLLPDMVLVLLVGVLLGDILMELDEELGRNAPRLEETFVGL
jgi:hypothetical protein